MLAQRGHVLALRVGADLTAITAVVMLYGAWQAPRRDMRHSEVWVTLDDWQPEVVRGRPKGEVQERLRQTLRRRLLWHAERVGLVALGLWAMTLVALAVKALF